ncbi:MULTISPECIES: cellulose binding domain-containing protein [unclassified Streptomyces]|uniref:cellulose binding domain-containing protein n=1 Tax=unclassified Streptomyces TaxID=2593676 RepID=UPI003869EBFF
MRHLCTYRTCSDCSSEQCSPRPASPPPPWCRPPDPPPCARWSNSTAHQWDRGFQRSVTLAGPGSATGGRSLGSDLPGERTVAQGRNALRSLPGRVVSAAGEGWNGTPANGADVFAGLLTYGAGACSRAGSPSGAFTLNGTLCKADPGAGSDRPH